MSTDNETRLRTVLRRLSNQRTESGVKAALALALWTQLSLSHKSGLALSMGQVYV